MGEKDRSEKLEGMNGGWVEEEEEERRTVVSDLELEVLDDGLHDCLPLLPEGGEAVGGHADASVGCASALCMCLYVGV